MNKKEQILRAHADYHDALVYVEDVLIKARNEAEAGRFSLEDLVDLQTMHPQVPCAEILSLESLIYLSVGEEGVGIEKLTKALAAHPMPLREALALARLHYKRGDFVKAIFYAAVLEDLERGRSETSFIDTARSIRAMALCQMGLNNIAKCVFVEIQNPHFKMKGERMMFADDIEAMIYKMNDGDA